jgi:GTPase SAR1 family protein
MASELKHISDVSMDLSLNLFRYKLVFVGDVGVGKTSIINRFMDNKFSESYDVNNLLMPISIYINLLSLAQHRSRFLFQNLEIPQ